MVFDFCFASLEFLAFTTGEGQKPCMNGTFSGSKVVVSVD